jgi:hypothetical protein
VLLAVKLDDKLRGMTVEINDETIERNLSPEFRAVKARAAQALPECVLGPGLLLVQSAGEFVALGGYRPCFSRGDPLTPAPLPPGEGGATPRSPAGISLTAPRAALVVSAA